MTIAERIQEAEQKFNTFEKQRQEHLKMAEECLTEITKLQGEYRVLQELLNEEPKVKVKGAK